MEESKIGPSVRVGPLYYLLGDPDSRSYADYTT